MTDKEEEGQRDGRVRGRKKEKKKTNFEKLTIQKLQINPTG